MSRSWSTFKSFLPETKELGSISDDQLVLGATAHSWRNAPTSAGTSTEAILQSYAAMVPEVALAHLQAATYGLSEEEAALRLHIKGKNALSSKKPPAWWQLALSVIPNPFNILLAALAIISVSTPDASWSTFILLMVMILISCVVRFWQEYRSSVAAIKLQSGVTTDVRVRRRIHGDIYEEITVDEKTLVPGDILLLDSGIALPADCLILESTNLNISQSSLTGESEPLRKTTLQHGEKDGCDLFDIVNLAFMGTAVISGSGAGLVLSTGDDAFIATIMQQLMKKRPLNSFQKGIRNVAYMMIVFMVVMVPIVLVISGKVTGDWQQAALFSVSVAVGLVPEMLPAIVNANLARGAFALSKKKAIVKRLDSIQNLGGMSVLCSDKVRNCCSLFIDIR